MKQKLFGGILLSLFCSSLSYGMNLPSQQNDDNGIYYTLVDNSYIEITKGKNQETIIIPEEIEVDGIFYPVEEIRENAFKEKTAIKTLYLPSTIKKIGRNAFLDTNIKELRIPDLKAWCLIDFEYDFNSGITFWNCSCHSNPLNYNTRLYVNDNLIEDLETPEGIEEIKMFTFQNLRCNKVIISDDVSYINDYAFSDCLLKELILGKNLEYLLSRAFEGALNLKTVHINSVLKYIGSGPFVYAEKIYVPTLEDWLNQPFYTTEENHFGSYNEEFSGHFIRHQYSLYIGEEHLQNLVIPEGVEEIKPLTFQYTDITSVTLPNSLKKIGDAAFKGTLIESVIIPENVESKLRNTFQYCNSLNEVEFKGNNVPYFSYTFDGCSNLKKVIMPQEISIPDGIKYKTFQDCFSLQEIVLPEGLEVIDEFVFNNSENLNYVTLPSTLNLLYGWSFTRNNIKGIEFKGTTPPEMRVFPDDIPGYVSELSPTECMLYVPEGCYQIYRDDPYWGEFENIVEGGLVTGIDHIKSDSFFNESKDSPIYDLQGRKVNPSNLTKGIYIQNGKKIVVRK